MKNLKLELFNFKKSLSIDQSDIEYVIEGHLNSQNLSEKQIILSLNEKLKSFTYDKEVKSFLESLNDDMKNYELLYELKNLYNVLNSKNQGELYRQPINVLLQTMNWLFMIGFQRLNYLFIIYQNLHNKKVIC